MNRALHAAVTTLLLTACLPLARAFHGLAFFRPVLAALLLALTLLWGARRLGAGPPAVLAIGLAGWALFVAVVFLPHTLRLGVLPTMETLREGAQVWMRGLELLQVRPAPVFAEAGLLLITVTGIWAVVHAVDGLVFGLRAPVKAIGMASVLWVVPLAVTPGAHSAWPWTVPFLAAAAALLLVSGTTDLRRWGPLQGTAEAEAALSRLAPRGAVLGMGAILAGVVLAGSLPGFGEQPWYRLRAPGGGTTVTDNPIVTIKASLVAQSRHPLLTVRTERPVYLRTTSLDVYNEREEWTNSGIRGAPVTGPLPFERPIARAEHVEVEIEVEDLPGAILVPVPYQVAELHGPASRFFQYDPRLSTVTLARDASLDPGDTYGARAAVPAPDPAALPATLVHDPTSPLAGLPAEVPASVIELAHAIVGTAGAQTPFEQAFAIQEELRSWTYSLDPPQGHSGPAMEAFVTNRVGYCEQYAGTMAVMLRALGIPARVAVGFTPGDVMEEGTYVVTNRHAHAWVEALTAEHGWLAFEPTPRDDGNVIVPTAANLAPTTTLAQQPSELADPLDPFPDDSEFLPDPQVADIPRQMEPDGGTAGASAGATGLRLLIAALLLVVALAGVAAAVALHRRDAAISGSPAERILGARASAERVARGLGVHPRASETDAEYLRRVAARSPRDGTTARAATLLAGHAARARYAPWVPEEGAAEAEAAARALIGDLVGELGPPRRALVRLRGELAAARTRGAEWASGKVGGYSSR